MKVRAKLTTLGLACLIGSGAGLAFATPAPEHERNFPAEKLQEIKDREVQQNSEPLISSDPALEPAFKDKGSPEDIDRVKEVLPQLLTDWIAPGRLKEGTVLPDDKNPQPSENQRKQNLALNSTDGQLAAAEQTIAEVFSSRSKVKETVEGIRRSTDEVLTVDSMADLGYFDNAMIISSFDGVAVLADTAIVLANGRQKYTLSNQINYSEPSAQYQLVLVRADSSKYGWLISEMEFVNLPNPVPAQVLEFVDQELVTHLQSLEFHAEDGQPVDAAPDFSDITLGDVVQVNLFSPDFQTNWQGAEVLTALDEWLIPIYREREPVGTTRVWIDGGEVALAGADLDAGLATALGTLPKDQNLVSYPQANEYYAFSGSAITPLNAQAQQFLSGPLSPNKFQEVLVKRVAETEANAGPGDDLVGGLGTPADLTSQPTNWWGIISLTAGAAALLFAGLVLVRSRMREPQTGSHPTI